MSHAPVALVRCESYDPDTVQAAVHRALALLGGPERYIQREGACLVKPNLVLPSRPDTATTTHPEVVRATVLEAQRVAKEVMVGDSPGRGDTVGTAEVAGIGAVCRETGVSLVTFDETAEVKVPEGRLCKDFTLSKRVVDAASLVNAAKMKTHGFMTYTGAVKNLFGCIPGTRKAKMHLRFQDPLQFSHMLVDLLQAVKPSVSILDAVFAMDGDGPSHGRARSFGAIIASPDAVAADSVALRLAGVDPMVVPYLRIASERGVGAVEAGSISILGDHPESFDIKDFQLPGSRPYRSLFWVAARAKRSITARPVVDMAKCTGCGQCARLCPPQAIKLSPERKAIIDDSCCIRCYCCHELCLAGAVSLRMGSLARTIDRIIDSLERR